jgi:hypothetical protein
MAIQFDNTNTGTATLRPATSGTIALTLPSADGTSGQAITTDGSGNLAFTTVGGGGGLTGFTAAESTTAPNATVFVDSLTAAASSTNADVAFVAKGTGATLAQVPTSTVAGGNKRGTHATDWQKSRNAATQVASGNYSSILGGQNNTVSNAYSALVGGLSNTITGDNAFLGNGFNNSATGSYSTIVNGYICTASGIASFVSSGELNLANSSYAFVGGGYGGSSRSIVGNVIFAASGQPVSGTVGAQQSATLVLGRQTTDATATVLRSNPSAAGTSNQVILPNNSAYFFQGQVVAGVTGAGDTKGWTVEGVIKRGANAASTVLVGSTVMSSYGDAGAVTWVVAVTADTTNGGLAITVTGQAATTIRWVAQIRTTEMTY